MIEEIPILLPNTKKIIIFCIIAVSDSAVLLMITSAFARQKKE